MRLVARGLAFAYPGAASRLYDGLDLDAQGGDMIALTGPSGSGKSTLLSILGGWLIPTAGTLHRTGIDRLSLVPQNPYGVAGRTALDHVCLPLVAEGMTRTAADHAGHRYLEMLQLAHVSDRPYRMLSGGERQRMLLARALASKPDLLLVDEPTAQLDPASATEVCLALASLQREGVLIFIATHDPRVSEACSHTVSVLNDGHEG